MDLSKAQERRLSFVASLLSLNPNDPTDRIKALRHMNLDEEGCFHGFQRHFQGDERIEKCGKENQHHGKENHDGEENRQSEPEEQTGSEEIGGES